MKYEGEKKHAGENLCFYLFYFFAIYRGFIDIRQIKKTTYPLTVRLFHLHTINAFALWNHLETGISRMWQPAGGIRAKFYG